MISPPPTEAPSFASTFVPTPYIGKNSSPVFTTSSGRTYLRWVSSGRIPAACLTSALTPSACSALSRALFSSLSCCIPSTTLPAGPAYLPMAFMNLSPCFSSTSIGLLTLAGAVDIVPDEGADMPTYV